MRFSWISVGAVATTVALSAAGCGSTPSEPSTPPPHVSASPHDVALSGRLVGTVTGEPIAGATIAAGPETLVTDEHGAFMLTGTSADVRDVTITGSGLVTRISRVSLAERDVMLDVIQQRPPFDLTFFRELGRNALESTTGLEPLRPIPGAPSVHIRTVDEEGQAMDRAIVDLVESALRDVAASLSGGRYPLDIITRGPETKAGQSGWVTVMFSGEAEVGGCGKATLGSTTGRIELNYRNTGCACSGNVVALATPTAMSWPTWCPANDATSISAWPSVPARAHAVRRVFRQGISAWAPPSRGTPYVSTQRCPSHSSISSPTGPDSRSSSTSGWATPGNSCSESESGKRWRRCSGDR